MNNSIAEWYHEAQDRLKKEYNTKRDLLDAALMLRQEHCDHELKLVKGLFYALGETYDGYMCDKCLFKTRDSKTIFKILSR